MIYPKQERIEERYGFSYLNTAWVDEITTNNSIIITDETGEIVNIDDCEFLFRTDGKLESIKFIDTNKIVKYAQRNLGMK